jgi:hypothetical protein
METGASDPTATRKLFEEWCARSEADGGALEDDDRSVSLWAHYVLFEIEYGGGAHARAVVDTAIGGMPTEHRDVC